MMSALAETATDGGAQPPSVKVWDPFIRVFHWGLAAAFTTAFVAADAWDRLHEAAGYTVAALVGLRVLWGVVGTKHARFADFVRGPAATLAYLKDMVAGRERRYLGHNPAGAVMVLALLTGVAGLAVTGVMMSSTSYGDVHWVEDLHEGLANGMLGLIALHVAGVAVTSLRHGENLVHAMITGRKRADGV